METEISNLEQQIEQYNQIKNSKRDDWQDTLIKAENLKSRQSTLKDVKVMMILRNGQIYLKKNFTMILVKSVRK